MKNTSFNVNGENINENGFEKPFSTYLTQSRKWGVFGSVSFKREGISLKRDPFSPKRERISLKQKWDES